MNDLSTEPFVEATKETKALHQEKAIRAPEEGNSPVISGWERFTRGRAVMVRLFTDPATADPEMN